MNPAPRKRIITFDKWDEKAIDPPGSKAVRDRRLGAVGWWGWQLPRPGLYCPCRWERLPHHL